MTSAHFNLNRPVHLARRDVYFEKAVELLHKPLSDVNTPGRIEHLKSVLALLSISVNHAGFAAKAACACDKDKDFYKYLLLAHDNVQSILSMIRHQVHLEEAESFLCQFLDTTPDQSSLPAMHYRRRADDLLEGICHLLRLAQTPFRSLQHENHNQMSPEDRKRFKTAYESYEVELQGKKDSEPAASTSLPL